MAEDDLSNYNVYICKDGRMRAYNKTTHSVTSYPRLILELALGRKLEKGEDVHHKDGNPLNNDVSNLDVISHSEHGKWHANNDPNFSSNKYRKYFDKEMICPVCGKTFIWTSAQQSQSISKKNAGPFCSRKCRGIYGSNIQNGRNPYLNFSK